MSRRNENAPPQILLLIHVQGRLQLWLRIRGATLLFSHYSFYLDGCLPRHR